jgi:uncharacterized membrane protein
MNPPIDESVTIARSPAEVFAFVSDFENLPQFCGTSNSVKKVSSGPIGRGTVFRQVFAMYGWRLDTPVELTAFDPDRSLTYRSQGGPRVEGSCFFGPDPAGTRLRYTVKIHPRGAYRLFAPLLIRILRRQTRQDLAKLKALLEQKPATAATGRSGWAGAGAGASG